MKLNLFKQKNFSILMFAKILSLTGTSMQGFAFSLYILKNTGSAAMLASVLAAMFIPKLMLGPLVGVFVDLFDRKKIIVYLDLLSGIVVGIFILIYILNGEISLTNIYILVIFLSLISVIYNPATRVVLPSIVDKHELVDANGINTIVGNLSDLIAPVIAATLFEVYGILPILLLNMISFIVSGLGELFMSIPKMNINRKGISIKIVFNEFVEGIDFIKNDRLVFGMIIIAMIVNFSIEPILSTWITFTSLEVLKIDNMKYGLLQTIFVMSMMIAPFICSSISKKITIKKLIFFDMLICSIIIICMSIVSSNLYINVFKNTLIPYISLIIPLSVIGVCITVLNIITSSLLQNIIPLQLMGRVNAVFSTGATGSIPLGQMIIGVLLDKLEAWIVGLIFALVPLITIILFKKYLLEDLDNK